MSEELKPCPFCNAAMRIESNRDWHRLIGDHDDECVFVDSETMMVPATDDQLAALIRDWSRRGAPIMQAVGDLEDLDPLDPRRLKLIAYGRSKGLNEASELCSKMAWRAYYPPGTRYKTFTPKAEKSLGDILIKAANEIANLPDGPYDRFKARQAKQ